MKVPMLRRLIQVTGILLAIGAVAVLSSAGGAIGMAVANGSFQVDHSAVYGNGTLFDGSVVETARASSRLQLTGGVRVRLAGDSRVKVYQHRLVLEQGLGEMESAGGFEVEARSLHIAAAPGSVARVKVENPRSVLVSAVRGALRVTSARGVLVASMETGNRMVFEPQAAGAEAPTRASGCLLEKAGKFLLAERTTNIVLELQGSDLEQQVGNQVEISGKAISASPGTPAGSQVIRVAGIKLIHKGGCASIAKKLGAAAVAAGATAAGASTASAGAAGAAGTVGAAGAGGAAAGVGVGIGTVTVIGGVAAAATVGGLAAVGDLPGQSTASPSASR
jgi:hypothetical protein